MTAKLPRNPATTTTGPKPLSCPTCQVPWFVERIQAGWVFVRPDNWWAPTTQHWTARCACRVLFGREEAELYRQMDVGYC